MSEVVVEEVVEGPEEPLACTICGSAIRRMEQTEAEILDRHATAERTTVCVLGHVVVEFIPCGSDEPAWSREFA